MVCLHCEDVTLGQVHGTHLGHEQSCEISISDKEVQLLTGHEVNRRTYRVIPAYPHTVCGGIKMAAVYMTTCQL